VSEESEESVEFDDAEADASISPTKELTEGNKIFNEFVKRMVCMLDVIVDYDHRQPDQLRQVLRTFIEPINARFDMLRQEHPMDDFMPLGSENRVRFQIPDARLSSPTASTSPRVLQESKPRLRHPL